jgi:2-amino-4-hydroxy-6-hydroxymethyldihydropteridine diphosphokinase
MTRAFLSMGSNLGDRLALLRESLRQLGASTGIRVLAASGLYETEPWERPPAGAADRTGWFLNCVVDIETDLAPAALLERLQAIEATLGRTRDPAQTPEAQRFEPRPLDIDILLYGDRVISVSDDLHIPHLLLHERAFVLRPLADLAPELVHPTLYRTMRELAEELDDRHVVHPGERAPRWFER